MKQNQTKLAENNKRKPDKKPTKMASYFKKRTGGNYPSRHFPPTALRAHSVSPRVGSVPHEQFKPIRFRENLLNYKKKNYA